MRRWAAVAFLGSWAVAQSLFGGSFTHTGRPMYAFLEAARPPNALIARRLSPPSWVVSFRDSLPNPRTALWLSALLPGAGQLYNRSYWKAPLIWGALALTGTLTYQSHKNYLRYRQAYRDALNGQNPFPTLPPENLRFIRESYRKDRDIFLLASLVVYALQIGEAYADAHLKGFTIYAAGGIGSVRLVCAW